LRLCRFDSASSPDNGGFKDARIIFSCLPQALCRPIFTIKGSNVAKFESVKQFLQLIQLKVACFSIPRVQNVEVLLKQTPMSRLQETTPLKVFEALKPFVMLITIFLKKLHCFSSPL
jgi:hypothetical protein